MTPRFSDSDLDRLEKYLDAPERIEATMQLDAVQGLVCAVASGPGGIPEPRWMAEVLGLDDEAPMHEESHADIRDLLRRFHDESARQLNEGDGFDFILYGPEGAEDLTAWAEGYLVGVDLAEPPWDELAEADDIDAMLYPFLLLSGQAKQMTLDDGEDWMSEEEEVHALAETRMGLVDHLVEVRRFWFEKSIPGTVRRDAPKVGRNDPCPCGSGKKYKSCHGQDA